VNTPNISEDGTGACQGPAEPFRILLVEDNLTNQRLMRRVLESMRCQVEVAGNGEEALNKLHLGRYHLVFMDCHMPVMDGFDTTTEIRRTEASARLPIIAVTASVLKEDHERCHQVGMNQVITKPIDPDDIRAALNRWCHSPSAPSA
jgi:CheY-like chemotaxis protein